VEWTPDVKVRLLNPGQLFKDGFKVLLAKEGAPVIDLNQQMIVQVREHGNIYLFDLCTLETSPVRQNYSSLSDDELACQLDNNAVALYTKSAVDMMHWHQHLGHLNTHGIQQLTKAAAASIDIKLGNTHKADCIACIEGK
jgi:hypothetical protein